MVTHPVLVLQRDFALKTKWDRVTTIFPHIDGGFECENAVTVQKHDELRHRWLTAAGSAA